MKKVMIINGPNLNLLGTREPEIYGRNTLESLNESLVTAATELNITLSFYQSNSEGEIIDHLQEAVQNFDGIILNPGGYTHTSVAILDAMRSISTPIVEVHLSNIHAREGYRRESLTASGAWGIISGFGEIGYHLALKALRERFNEE